MTREEAIKILESDPELLEEENGKFRKRVANLFGEDMTLTL